MIRDLLVRKRGLRVHGDPERHAAEDQVLTEIARAATPAIDRALLVEALPPRPVVREGRLCPLCPNPEYAGPTVGGELRFRDDPIDGPRLECSASSFHTFPIRQED